MRYQILEVLGGYVVRCERWDLTPLEWGPYARREDAEAQVARLRREPSLLEERAPKKPRLRKGKRGQLALPLP